MSDSGDVGGDFDAVGEAHARHLPQSRIRLLGCRSVHARTNSTLLRAAFQCRTRCLPGRRFPPITHKLIKRWHEFPLREANQKYMWSNPLRPESTANKNARESQRTFQLQVATARITLLLWTGPCSNQEKSWPTSGPHPRPDPYTRVVAQGQKASSRE